jgi:hypothetical protein
LYNEKEIINSNTNKAMKTYTVFLNFIRPEDMETDTHLVKVIANNSHEAQTQVLQYIELLYGPMGWKVFRLSKEVYPDFNYETPYIEVSEGLLEIPYIQNFQLQEF